MGRVAEPTRLEVAKVGANDTIKVALWIAFSAGVTALLTWALNEPKLLNFYGLINIALYAIKELKKVYDAK